MTNFAAFAKIHRFRCQQHNVILKPTDVLYGKR